MTADIVAGDQELVDRLDEVWTSIEGFAPDLSDDEWARPTEVPGWSVQDNLVHLTAIESMLLGRPLPKADIADLPAHVKNDFGRANERWIESRRSWTGADCAAEFHEVTRARVASLRALDRAGFDAESWTPMGPGTVRTMLPFRVFDCWVHEQDMRRALRRPGDLDTPVAAFAYRMMQDALGFIVGKKAGAPEGALVVFALDGPLARQLTVAVVDGRARLVDGVPAGAAPTVVVRTDTEIFARLLNGRLDPLEQLAAGTVVLDGDEGLGARVLAEINFLF
jgi:uncharacterized protein (TIGR03083 family)